MSVVPQNLRYAKTHEWVDLVDGSVLVGITDHAQDLLGDMVYVELPTVGRQVSAGEECAVVESVKAASDIYSPVSGEIVAVNENLSASPEIINKQPYSGGWILRIRPAQSAEMDALLSPEAYAALVAAERHS